jgi:allophanate hydrolase subunit 2
MRLEGGQLRRGDDSEIPSEGMVRGAVQVPAGGEPVVFLADHPVTGGYPVVATVCDADVDRAAQVRPGQGVRFVVARRGRVVST